jgi:hypothetical protein
MPRDDWAKFRAREVARKAERRNERSSLRSIERHKAHKKQKVAAARLQSWKTVFWFGRHKGKTVSEVNACDPSYIAFLAKKEYPESAWKMNMLVQFLKRISHQHSPRNGHPALAAVMREDEALATSIEGQGKSVARIGTSAEPDFDQVFESLRRESA